VTVRSTAAGARERVGIRPKPEIAPGRPIARKDRNVRTARKVQNDGNAQTARNVDRMGDVGVNPVVDRRPAAGVIRIVAAIPADAAVVRRAVKTATIPSGRWSPAWPLRCRKSPPITSSL